jgi:hypothetical protein
MVRSILQLVVFTFIFVSGCIYNEQEAEENSFNSEGNRINQEKAEMELEARKLFEASYKKYERPSYHELATNSNIVAIVKLVEASYVPWDRELNLDFFSEDSGRLIKSRLAVLACLKGELEGEIDFYSLGIKEDMGYIGQDFDFAGFRKTVSIPDFGQRPIIGVQHFPTSARDIKYQEIEVEYLVFLKDFRDGRYHPVTGDQFSARSVRLINDSNFVPFR